MGGRYPGTTADSAVQAMIAGRFRIYGLAPVHGSYLQRFDFPHRYYVDGKIICEARGRTDTLRNGRDFMFNGWNRSDSVSLDCVFGGHMLFDSRLTDPAVLKDKAVVVFTTPLREYRPVQQWIDEHKRVYDYEFLERCGIKALLEVSAPERPMSFYTFKGAQKRSSDMIMASISYPAFERIAGSSMIREYTQTVLSKRCYNPVPLEGRTVTITCRKYADTIRTGNVVGLKKGRNDQYIVIGAHHDHLGYRTDLGVPGGALYPGANDNASGVAMMLELAKYFAGYPTDCNILFAAFAREENGRLGSFYFWDHLPVDTTRIKAMINLDMAGDLRNNTLYHQTYHNVAGGLPIYNKAMKLSNSNLDIEKMVGGLSDDQVFFEHSIPIFYMHTGRSSTLHTPQDTEDKINYEGMEKIFEYLKNLVKVIDKEELEPVGSRIPK